MPGFLGEKVDLDKTNTKNKELTHLLATLGAAVLAAFLIAACFVWFYGKDGQYTAGRALLSPSLLERLNFQADHPRTKERVYFIFGEATLTLFNEKEKRNETKKWTSKEYAAFYDLVKNDKSLDNPGEALKQLFIHSQTALLTTTMQTAENQKESQLFQVVQFIKEDYYRIQLQGNPGDSDWAYFYHKEIYKTVETLVPNV